MRQIGWLRRHIRPVILRLRLRTYGFFRFYGHDIYAPNGSLIFKRWADEGEFEPDVIEAMVALAAANSWVFDVGANIGLLSAATLFKRQDIHVASFECSPSTLPFLSKTHSRSPYRARWKLIETAVGRKKGVGTFYTSGAESGAYDGLKDTGRGGATSSVTVSVQTLDLIWDQMGRPQVSLIKMDIEGGEFDALAGASELLSVCRPIIVLEWNRENLRAYGLDPLSLYDLRSQGFEIYSMPYLQRVNANLLPLAMTRTETFIAAPTDRVG